MKTTDQSVQLECTHWVSESRFGGSSTEFPAEVACEECHGLRTSTRLAGIVKRWPLGRLFSSSYSCPDFLPSRSRLVTPRGGCLGVTPAVSSAPWPIQDVPGVWCLTSWKT